MPHLRSDQPDSHLSFLSHLGRALRLARRSHKTWRGEHRRAGEMHIADALEWSWPARNLRGHANLARCRAWARCSPALSGPQKGRPSIAARKFRGSGLSVQLDLHIHPRRQLGGASAHRPSCRSDHDVHQAACGCAAPTGRVRPYRRVGRPAAVKRSILVGSGTGPAHGSARYAGRSRQSPALSYRSTDDRTALSLNSDVLTSHNRNLPRNVGRTWRVPLQPSEYRGAT